MSQPEDERARRLGHALRELRERAGLTQAELGALINVSDGAIRNAESGRNPPSRRHIEALQKYGDIRPLMMLRESIKRGTSVDVDVDVDLGEGPVRLTGLREAEALCMRLVNDLLLEDDDTVAKIFVTRGVAELPLVHEALKNALEGNAHVLHVVDSRSNPVPRSQVLEDIRQLGSRRGLYDPRSWPSSIENSPEMFLVGKRAAILFLNFDRRSERSAAWYIPSVRSRATMFDDLAEVARRFHKSSAPLLLTSTEFAAPGALWIHRTDDRPSRFTNRTVRRDSPEITVLDEKTVTSLTQRQATALGWDGAKTLRIADLRRRRSDSLRRSLGDGAQTRQIYNIDGVKAMFDPESHLMTSEALAFVQNMVELAKAYPRSFEIRLDRSRRSPYFGYEVFETESSGLAYLDTVRPNGVSEHSVIDPELVSALVSDYDEAVRSDTVLSRSDSIAQLTKLFKERSA